MKAKPGRKQIYDPKKLAEDLLKAADERVFTIEAFCGKNKMAKDTFYRLLKSSAELTDAFKIYRMQVQYELQKVGTDAMHSKAPFQTGPWAMFMKNTCGWRDKVELVDEDEIDGMDFVA